jgi:hypothetical protein
MLRLVLCTFALKHMKLMILNLSALIAFPTRKQPLTTVRPFLYVLLMKQLPNSLLTSECRTMTADVTMSETNPDQHYKLVKDEKYYDRL